MKGTTISDLRVAVVVKGEEYMFLNAAMVDVNDPRVLSLIASRQGLTDGLIQEDGVSSEVTISLELYEVPADVIRVLKKAWDEKERIDLKMWGRVSREAMTAVRGIIKTNPYNGTIQEGETASLMLNTAFVRNNLDEGILS